MSLNAEIYPSQSPACPGIFTFRRISGEDQPCRSAPVRIAESPQSVLFEPVIVPVGCHNIFDSVISDSVFIRHAFRQGQFLAERPAGHASEILFPVHPIELFRFMDSAVTPGVFLKKSPQVRREPEVIGRIGKTDPARVILMSNRIPVKNSGKTILRGKQLSGFKNHLDHMDVTEGLRRDPGRWVQNENVHLKNLPADTKNPLRRNPERMVKSDWCRRKDLNLHPRTRTAT